MIDHRAVLIGLPDRGSCDPVRDLDLEHLAIEGISRRAGAGLPPTQSYKATIGAAINSFNR